MPMMSQMQGRPLLGGITTLTCFSFLLIGFDNGVLGGLVGQPAFNETFGTPGATIVGLIVALYEVGCFLGAVFTAIFGERLGRTKTILAGSIIMIIGALLQATSYGRPQIIVARIVSGVGMGLINSTAPVYQSEFSPKASRGMFACAQLSTLNLGIFVSYWIDYGFAGQLGSYAWRVPVILQCIFIVPITVLAIILPESPRWLIAHGRTDEAWSIFERLYVGRASKHHAREVYDGVVRSTTVEHAAQVGFISVLRGDAVGSRHRFLIACGIQFFQQLGGVNGVIYYAGTIFEKSIGFSAHFSALMSGFVFTWFFVASFIPWFLIDRIGRRPLLLSMISLMACVFAIQAALVRQIQYQTAIAHAAGIGAAAMLFIYLGAFTIGFQATVWVYPPEILPLHLRQTGTAVATACNWIINFMVVQVTPPGIANIGYKYYIIFAIFNACFVPIIYFFFPETKGLELEEVDRLFANEETKHMMDEADTDVKSRDALFVEQAEIEQKSA